MDATVFSQRVSGLIESSGKTLRGVALDLDIVPATLSRYISGVRYPDVRYIAKLSQYFNVSMEWILGLSDERYEREGEGIAELVNLYSVATEDDRELVMHILKKYKNAGASNE